MKRKIALGALTLCILASVFPKNLSATEIELMSDDVFVLQYYNEQKRIEEEKKAEEERKLKIEKEKAIVKSLSGTPYVIESQEPTIQGTIRLAKHNDSYDEMVRKINKKLSNYPMRDLGKTIVDAGLKYNVDPYFITAIAIHESSAGRNMINSYNPFGRRASGGGWMAFSSFEEAIYNQANYLSYRYLDRGLNTIEKIAKVYCPPTAADWARKKNATVAEIARL